ncbi:MAG: TM2 domain-containing protein [Opitutaceae bacterium]
MSDIQQKATDEKFCESCGKIIKKEAELCVHCGVRQRTAMSAVNPSGRTMVAAALLCFFLGFVGVHRFYTGKVGTGILMLLTLGGCGVWTIIDFIMILTGSYRDGDNQPLTK